MGQLFHGYPQRKGSNEEVDTRSQDVGVFIPMLCVTDVTAAIDFYTRALAAKLRWKIDHEGKVHVAELEVEGTLLRLHEESKHASELSPQLLQGTSVVIHLLVAEPDNVFERCVLAGATMLSPMKDYEYGFRQGNLADPFGHHWCLERMDNLYKKPLQ